MRSLVRTQLLLAVRVLAVVGALLASLPLLFTHAPSTRDVSVLGLPLPWLLLGVLFYPALVVVGWVHMRLAERNERDFVDVVERS